MPAAQPRRTFTVRFKGGIARFKQGTTRFKGSQEACKSAWAVAVLQQSPVGLFVQDNGQRQVKVVGVGMRRLEHGRIFSLIGLAAKLAEHEV